MSDTDPSQYELMIHELSERHRALDEQVDRLQLERSTDQLTLARLKKEKLRLKDMITYYRSRLIPDLDA